MIVDDVRKQLNINKVTLQTLRTYSQVCLQLEIPCEITTINKCFETLIPYFCFIQYYCLEDLVARFLGDCKSIKAAFEDYKKELVKFKKSAPIKNLCDQISMEMSHETRNVVLKLMGFWSHVTVERFEKLVKYLIQKPETHLGRISVRDGCVLISWVVLPNVLIEDLVTGLVYSKEFMSSVGIISLVVCGRVIFKSDVPQNLSISIDKFLLRAFEVGSINAVILLLSVNEINIDNYNTAILGLDILLFTASENGLTTIVSDLLKYGANPNITINDFITPLMVASQRGHHEIIDLLWKYGAEINDIAPSGDTALHMACCGNHIKAVEILLSLGADPCITNKSGHTPVYYATGEILTIIKDTISRFELYSTFDYNISTLSSLPQPSSLPTFNNRSPLLSSYKSPNSSSDVIVELSPQLFDVTTLSTFEYLFSQNIPGIQDSFALLHHSSSNHTSRSSISSVMSRCSPC